MSHLSMTFEAPSRFWICISANYLNVQVRVISIHLLFSFYPPHLIVRELMSTDS